MRRIALILLVCSTAGCRCKPPIGMVETGFRVEETELDFGRVRENTQAQMDVHIVSTGLGALSLSLSTTGPFVAPATVELEGGGGVAVTVTFNARDLPVEGELTVASSGGEVKVKLKGLGVHPLDCMPSAPCHKSEYVIETHTCSETVLPDNTDCTPTSSCLEGGKCLSGVCQGVARSCDDNNKCTIDGCAEGMGCLNPVRSCPPPTALCRVSAGCDPGTGICGEAQAPDLTPCGQVDCVRGSFCFAGNCITMDTPEGWFPCAPGTPCQGPGVCRSKVCTRPDAGVLEPDLTLRLGGAPPVSRPMLLTFAGQLYGEVCSVALPPVRLDGGFSEDGGVLDGGFADGGIGCALFSYTNNGFSRFSVKFPDERPLVHVANTGAAVLDDAGLELRSAGNGELLSRHELPGPASPRGVASPLRGRPWVLTAGPDGGAVLVRLIDGGVEPLATLGASVERLALDEQERAWVSNGVLAGLLEFNDGGLAAEPRWFPTAPALTGTLATAEGFALAGSTQFIGSAADAGLIASPSWLDDAGQPLRVHERFNLVGQDRAVVFYGRCPVPMMSCAPEDDQLRVRTFRLSTGQISDDGAIGPPRFAAKVVESSLIDVPGLSGAAVALVQLHHDAGTASAYLALAIGGAELTCPLPPNSDVAGAAFGNDTLWVYVSRDGGAYTLESYSLKPDVTQGTSGVGLSASGWPLADGVSGQRRAR